METHPRGAVVSVSMIMYENGLGFFLSVVNVEPSGGFREQKGEDEDERREENLLLLVDAVKIWLSMMVGVRTWSQVIRRHE